MANTTGKKFGGRKKGTPNKQTKEIRESYKLLIEKNLNKMTRWINIIAKDNPEKAIEILIEKAIEILIKLSEYVVPKLNRTEIKDITTLEDMTEMTREERDKRIEELIKKHQNN